MRVIRKKHNLKNLTTVLGLRRLSNILDMIEAERLEPMQPPCVILTHGISTGQIDRTDLEAVAKNHIINLSGGYILERQGPLNLIEEQILEAKILLAKIKESDIVDPDEML